MSPRRQPASDPPFDFAPLYRSTVGFEQLIDLLDTSDRPDWPPYDIEKLSDDDYRISMAVAGFKQSEIEITQEGPSPMYLKQNLSTKGSYAPSWIWRARLSEASLSIPVAYFC